MTEHFMVDGMLYAWGPWRTITTYMRLRYAYKVAPSEKLAEEVG